MTDLVRTFGPVWGASGVQGFFGEGYWFHRISRPWFGGTVFVAKTTTLLARAGNTPLRDDGITPREWFPRSVRVYFMRGSMLNSWGLSGPGAEELLNWGEWQLRTQPFMISFMSTDSSEHTRLRELEAFVNLLYRHLPSFQTKLGLQINLSCPNVGLDPSALVGEALTSLDIASQLDIPLIPKINALVPADVVAEMARHPGCAAICTSNTIPWGSCQEYIPWEKFGHESPLKHLGGGGLSGKYLLRAVLPQIREIRRLCPDLHINACGGIMSAADVDRVHLAGASSISIGTVATLRPWRTRRVIVRGHELFGEYD
jgi:dihydroorotate dehydrogenase